MDTDRVSAEDSDLPTVRLAEDSGSGSAGHASTHDGLAASGDDDPLDDHLGLPETVGRHRVLERLGRGGMGVVYATVRVTPCSPPG